MADYRLVIHRRTTKYLDQLLSQTVARDFCTSRRGEAHSEQSRPYKPAFNSQSVELRSLVQTWIIESVETVQLTERMYAWVPLLRD